MARLFCAGFLEAQMTLHQQIIHVNGVDINVASAGEGRPVVLLHGFPDTHNVWRKQFDPLVEAGYRVIAPDMRGYGASAAPIGVKAYSGRKLCADVIGVLDAMQVERAYLVAHDWGAVIGWQLCMHAPARVERFAALSVGHPTAWAQAGLSQRLKACYMVLFQVPGFAEFLLRAGNLMALKRFAADAEQVADWRANFAGEGRLTAALNYYRASKKMGAARVYPNVRMPVMGIWSEGDPALTESQMRDSVRHVSGPFRYERLSGEVGHWMQLSEAAQVNQRLLEFGATRFGS